MSFRETEVSQIRAWMRSVMERREWSAEHWATLAETSPTNITRFLRDATHIPSTRTIAKLSRACGSMPEIGRGIVTLAPRERSVPLYSAAELIHAFSNNEMLAAAGRKVVSTMSEVGENAFAFSVTGHSMDLRGISPGDVLICEPVAVQAPRPGSVVAYAVEDDLRIGTWQEPWIVHHSVAGLPAVKAEDVTLIGVGVEVRRAL